MTPRGRKTGGSEEKDSLFDVSTANVRSYGERKGKGPLSKLPKGVLSAAPPLSRGDFCGVPQESIILPPENLSTPTQCARSRPEGDEPFEAEVGETPDGPGTPYLQQQPLSRWRGLIKMAIMCIIGTAIILTAYVTDLWSPADIAPMGKKLSAALALSGGKNAAPSSLLQALADDHPDREVWLQSFYEEKNSIKSMNAYQKITLGEYCTLREKGAPKAIPTMCVLTIKHDEALMPVRAKS